MTVLIILGQVLVAFLAVLGLALLRVILEGCFAPKAITVAVTIGSREDADALDILLSEAQKSIFRRRGVPVAVLISPQLMRGILGNGESLYPEYLEMLTHYGAVAYIISEKDQPSSV